MKAFISVINVVLQSFVGGFFFGLGILSAVGIAGIVVANKFLPVVNNFLGGL